MALMTLTQTRAAAVRLLAIRSDVRTLTDESDALSAALRPALSHWCSEGQGIAATDATTLYLAAGSLRKVTDSDALAALARRYGASDAEIAECVKITAASPALKSRNRKATDR